MKKVLLISVLLLGVITLNAQVTKKNVDKKATTTEEPLEKKPEITFEKTVYDYGQIYVGDNGESLFKFRNTGTADLILTNCSSSCGCTVPEWPRTPIAPGATAEIKVKYNTGRMGAINKQVYVDSNTGQRVILTITGNVSPKPTEAVPENTNNNMIQTK